MKINLRDIKGFEKVLKYMRETHKKHGVFNLGFGARMFGLKPMGSSPSGGYDYSVLEDRDLKELIEELKERVKE